MKYFFNDLKLDYEYLSGCVNAMFPKSMPLDWSDLFELEYKEEISEIWTRSEFVSNINTYLYMLAQEGDEFKPLLDANKESFDSFFKEFSDFFNYHVSDICKDHEETTLEFITDELNKRLEKEKQNA